MHQSLQENTKTSKRQRTPKMLYKYGNVGVNISDGVKDLIKHQVGHSILTKISLKCIDFTDEFGQIEVMLKKEKNKICVLFFVEGNKQVGASSFYKPDFSSSGVRMIFSNDTMYLPNEA